MLTPLRSKINVVLIFCSRRFSATMEFGTLAALAHIRVLRGMRASCARSFAENTECAG